MAGLDTSIVGSASEPAMRFIGNEELQAHEDAEKLQNTPKISGLSSFIQKQWESARNEKEHIDVQLLRNQRQRNGDYDPEKLAMIREQGGTEVYMMLTAAKCRAAEAWIKDIVLNGQEEPFSIKPSEIPEISPEQTQQIQQQVYMEAEQQAQQIVMADGVVSPEELAEIRDSLAGRAEELIEITQKQIESQAEKTAKGMESKIIDQFQDGGFSEQLGQVIADIVTFKAGILKGPIIRKRNVLNWENTPEGFKPVESEELRIEFERRSPYDIFPSPDSSDINEGFLIDRQRLSVEDLNAMKGVDGYDSDSIDAVIEEYGRGGLREWLTNDSERRRVEDKIYDYENNSNSIDAIEYWGTVPGVILLDNGFTEEDIQDKYASYEVNAWLIGRWIIKASLNSMPLSARPYSKASYEDVAGSFWGRGVPELIEDLQQILNATARSLVNNLAIAAGTQVAINDINRIPAGEDVENIYPNKIWQFTPDMQSNGQKPIEFFQPEIIANQLLPVYQYYAKLADDYSGIPAFVQGNDDAKGAGKTASGMSMIMTHASRGIKDVVYHIDKGIIEPAVDKTYVYNMLYDEDESIKGEVNIQSKGALSLFNKEQAQIRRNEFLMSTNNPADMQIIGMKGRAALLREATKALDMPVDEVIPSEEEIEYNAEMQNAQMMNAQTLNPAGVPAESATVF